MGQLGCHLRHLPGLLLRVIVHHGPQHHQLDATALEERHLVLLAQLGEAEDLFGHLDDSLDGQLSQVDDTKRNERNNGTDDNGMWPHLMREGSALNLLKLKSSSSPIVSARALLAMNSS